MLSGSSGLLEIFAMLRSFSCQELFRQDPNDFGFVSSQTVNLSPTAEIGVDSPSALYDSTSADSTPLNTKNPSFEVQLPEDSKQRVNKGFRVSEILGNTHSYRSSILDFFTNFAK